ncbi:MAG: DUF6788 family protein [Candidatus Hodarchaeales archaeon]
MPAIVAKLQRCGKNNCRCSTSGELHGPYFWIVSYRRKRDRNGRGRYEWKYLGKSMKIVLEKIINEVPDFLENFGKEKIIQAIQKAQSSNQTDFSVDSLTNPRIRPILGNLSKQQKEKAKPASSLVES